VPFPDDSSGRDVDLLDDAVVEDAVLAPSDGREVGRHLPIDRDQGRAAARELELVLVARIPMTRSDDA
jgi:hypothetical protein